VALEVGVVGATVRENIGNSMAHGFADAQLPLRSAGGGILFLVMTWHRCLSNRQCPQLLRATTTFLFHQRNVDDRIKSGHHAFISCFEKIPNASQDLDLQ
jgi:hypothetical protein